MFKALLHKQMIEVRNMYFNRKQRNGQARKTGSKGLTVLFAILYFIVAASFFMICFLLGEPLISAGLAWVFFMIMTVLSFLFGIFGSAFSTSAALFQAKDNEFLLSLPIPPSKILLARMVSVYIMGIIYESLILLPTVVFYFIFGRPSVLSVILCILSFFVLGFLVLVFSCLLGWVIALVSSKLKNKSVLTVLIAVIFIGLFVWLRFQMDSFFRSMAEHAQEIADAVQGWGYPIYSLGLGMTGDILAFLVFTAITAVLFGLTCLILSKSFIHITATKDQTVKANFSERQIRTQKASAALRRKEFKRFTSSPNYMLNCGMGVLFMIAGIVLLLINTGTLRDFHEMMISETPQFASYIPVACAFLVCLFASMVDISAPSISLEGKGIWQLQVMPLDAYEIFKAKLFVHVLIAGIPSILCTIAMIFVFQTGVFASICMLLCVVVFVVMTGSAMLALDLKRPMLDWTNETQPIKQSTNILFSTLGSLFFALILMGLYLIVSMFAGPEVYLIFCIVLMAVLTFLLHKWLRGKGRKLFAELG